MSIALEANADGLTGSLLINGAEAVRVAGDGILVSKVKSDVPHDAAGVPYHGLIQIVSKVITAQGSQTLGIADQQVLGVGSDFAITITPRRSGSYIKVTARWFGEVDVPWNTVFNIHKNGARLNVGSTANTHGLAMPCVTYGAAADNNSTPEMVNLFTVDTAGTQEGVPITYALVVSTDVTKTMWTNRCFGAYETGVSEIMVEEIAR